MEFAISILIVGATLVLGIVLALKGRPNLPEGGGSNGRTGSNAEQITDQVPPARSGAGQSAKATKRSAYAAFNAQNRRLASAAVERGRSRGAAEPEELRAWLCDVSDCGPKVVTEWVKVSRKRPRDPAPRLVRDAREAEELAALWVRAMGYEDAEVTAFSKDGGLDVVARSSGGLGAQVKFEAKPVGSPALQQAVGATLGLGLQRTMFFRRWLHLRPWHLPIQ